MLNTINIYICLKVQVCTPYPNMDDTELNPFLVSSSDEDENPIKIDDKKPVATADEQSTTDEHANGTARPKISFLVTAGTVLLPSIKSEDDLLEWEGPHDNASLYDGLVSVLANANHLKRLAMLRSNEGPVMASIYTRAPFSRSGDQFDIRSTTQKTLVDNVQTESLVVHVPIPEHPRFAFVFQHRPSTITAIGYPKPGQQVIFIPSTTQNDTTLYDMLAGGGSDVPMYNTKHEKLIRRPYSNSMQRLIKEWGTFECQIIGRGGIYKGETDPNSTTPADLAREFPDAKGFLVRWFVPPAWLETDDGWVVDELDTQDTDVVLRCVYFYDGKIRIFENIRYGHQDKMLTIGLCRAELIRGTTRTCMMTLRSPTDADNDNVFHDTADFLPWLTSIENCIICLITSLRWLNVDVKRQRQPEYDQIVWVAGNADNYGCSLSQKPQPMFLETFGFEVIDETRCIMTLADISIETMQANSWNEYQRRLKNHVVEAYKPTIVSHFSEKFDLLARFTSGTQTVHLKECTVFRKGDDGDGIIKSPCIKISFIGGIARLDRFYYKVKRKEAEEFNNSLKPFYPGNRSSTQAMLLVLQIVKWWAVTNSKTSYVLQLEDGWKNLKNKMTSKELMEIGNTWDRHGYYTRYGFWQITEANDEEYACYARNVYCAWTGDDELEYFKSVSQKLQGEAYFSGQKSMWLDWTMVPQVISEGSKKRKILTQKANLAARF